MDVSYPVGTYGDDYHHREGVIHYALFMEEMDLEDDVDEMTDDAWEYFNERHPGDEDYLPKMDREYEDLWC
jgi:hypothetical protein